ncbi:hypothetical protein L1987_00797 [Smallanthus sonchifolius]|uniref:Uncharacterized protein n=1 Tax=Smallanthus sonchifolius TaxID=185202 RepID=A0ACB9K3I4_9ASTR|nr:hypothetical protein L1987_00797 [Smallanthus sonchifolius]
MKSVHSHSTFDGTVTPFFGTILGEQQAQQPQVHQQHPQQLIDEVLVESASDTDPEAIQSELHLIPSHIGLNQQRKRKTDGNPPSASSSHKKRKVVSSDTSDEDFTPSIVQNCTVRKTVHTIPVRSTTTLNVSQIRQTQPVVEEAYMHIPTPPTTPPAQPQDDEEDHPYDPNDHSMLPQTFIDLRNEVEALGVAVVDLKYKMAEKDLKIDLLNATFANQSKDIKSLKATVSSQNATIEKLYELVESLIASTSSGARDATKMGEKEAELDENLDTRIEKVVNEGDQGETQGERNQTWIPHIGMELVVYQGPITVEANPFIVQSENVNPTLEVESSEKEVQGLASDKCKRKMFEIDVSYVDIESEYEKSSESESEDDPELNKLYEDIDQFVDNPTFDVDEFDEVIKKVEYITSEGERINGLDDSDFDLDSSLEVIKETNEVDQ